MAKIIVETDKRNYCLKLWGHNAEKQVAVPIMPGRFEVKGHTSSVRRNIDTNELWATGLNNCGQLGNNTTIPSGSLSQIPGDWIGIGAGFTTYYGIKGDCTLWTWADTYSTGVLRKYSSPIQIPGSWVCVVGGCFHTLGIRTDGSLYAWGNNNFGQLGNGLTTCVYSPIQIPGIWSDIAAPNNSSFAIRNDGITFGWGDNSSGQFGINTTIPTSSPIQINSSFVRIFGYPVAPRFGGLTNNGAFFISGNGASGALGNNSTINRSSFVQIPGCWIDISIAQCHTNGIKSDNSLWGWGLGCSLAIPGSNSSPITVPGCWEKVFSLSLAGGGLCVNGSVETKEYNKNYNRCPFTLNETYICSRGDNWSDFIPTIDD